ncbi:hypothetical protein [Caenimonas soli]|uniref:hypothetical protein n=1 Tax=Caenimonas soli TaxID=2735555 RepID=UPI00155611D3|nr:hypothetical protein [Caenimonas soli]NPC56666.1 hypothetical protein [Caenimonas soli]
MSTPISYWFLAKPTLPPFSVHGGVTPKEYIETHFSKDTSHRLYGAGTLPHSTVITRADLVAAGLSAGYGKELSWSRTYTAPVSSRAPLYDYLRRKLEAVLACVEISSGKIRPREFWGNVEPTEKAGVSFNLGSLGAALAADRWMHGAGHTVTRFLHTRLFIDAAIVKKPIALSAIGDKFPDYLVQDSGGGWHVFEAKGGDAGSRWRQLAQGLQQVAQVTSVGEVGKAASPCSAVCVQTLVKRAGDVEFTLIDPPPQEEDGEPPKTEPPVEIHLVPELADLLLTLEAIDWFACFSDPVQLRTADSEMVTSTLLGFRVAESVAFGGVQLAIPEEFFTLAPKARAALHVIERFRAAARVAFETSDHSPTPAELTRSARAIVRQQKVSPGLEADLRVVELGNEALLAAIDDSEFEEDFDLWQSRVLKRVAAAADLGGLSARLTEAKTKALQRLDSIRKANSAPGSNEAAVSAGGLLVLFPAIAQT